MNKYLAKIKNKVIKQAKLNEESKPFYDDIEEFRIAMYTYVLTSLDRRLQQSLDYVPDAVIDDFLAEIIK